MTETPVTSHYIDGTWRTDTPTVDIHNPATEETIATIPDADEAVVAEALSAAQSAQESGTRHPVSSAGRSSARWGACSRPTPATSVTS
jgi:NAD-dependent aldehyde dehydrogenases